MRGVQQVSHYEEHADDWNLARATRGPTVQDLSPKNNLSLVAFETFSGASQFCRRCLNHHRRRRDCPVDGRDYESPPHSGGWAPALPFQLLKRPHHGHLHAGRREVLLSVICPVLAGVGRAVVVEGVRRWSVLSGSDQGTKTLVQDGKRGETGRCIAEMAELKIYLKGSFVSPRKRMPAGDGATSGG